MEKDDKMIMEHELAGPIGKLVRQWVKKNGIDEPVSVRASVVTPTCYVDEHGMVHNGSVVICDVFMHGPEDYDDLYTDDDED